MTISEERIILTAKERGISHAHLARKMGTYRTRLSECRNNKSTLSDEEVQICADELGVTVAYLNGETDDPNPPSEKPATQKGDGLNDLQREAYNAMIQLDPEDAEIVKNLAVSLAKKHTQE